MGDIFETKDVRRALQGKSLLFIGDSIMRNIYKDLVWLSSNSGLIPKQHLRDKGEEVFLGDKLIHRSTLTTGRTYQEKRDWYDEELDIQYTFVFITKCYSKMIERLMRSYEEEFGSYPDVIMMNSALWDVNRWGPRGIYEFKSNLRELLKLLEKTLPDPQPHTADGYHTQMIWMTTPPISVEIRGGFMIEQLEFQQHSMRFNINEANHFAARKVAMYGYDVVDMHYYMNLQIQRRSSDGIHWNPDAVRMQVNIFLTHYCLSNDVPLPGNCLPGPEMDSEAMAANAWKAGFDDAAVAQVTNVHLREAMERADAARADDDVEREEAGRAWRDLEPPGRVRRTTAERAERRKRRRSSGSEAGFPSEAGEKRRRSRDVYAHDRDAGADAASRCDGPSFGDGDAAVAHAPWEATSSSSGAERGLRRRNSSSRR